METENSKSKEGLIQSQIVMSYILQGPISKFRSAGKSDKSVETLLHDIAGLHSCLWYWTLLAPLGMENTSCFWVNMCLFQAAIFPARLLLLVVSTYIFGKKKSLL